MNILGVQNFTKTATLHREIYYIKLVLHIRKTFFLFDQWYILVRHNIDDAIMSDKWYILLRNVNVFHYLNCNINVHFKTSFS